MTRDERLRAFELRVDGATWEQIAAALHYDRWTISRDLRSVLDTPPASMAVESDALTDYINTHHGGSLYQFARAIGVSPYRLRRVLVFGDRPTAGLRRKIAAATGLSEKEIFGDVLLL